MSSDLTCEQCRLQLDGLLDESIGQEARAALDAHLDECEACSGVLAELWQLKMMATRWQDRQVPHWNRRAMFFDTPTWLPRLQIASAFASLLVLALVLARVEISTADGFSVQFGESYATAEQVDARVQQLKRDQEMQLQAGFNKLTSQQVASNQLLLRTVLDLSRQERREELSEVVTLLDETRDQRYRETEQSLRYLVESQLEDRRNIRQLNQAIRLVANEGGTL